MKRGFHTGFPGTMRRKKARINPGMFFAICCAASLFASKLFLHLVSPNDSTLTSIPAIRSDTFSESISVAAQPTSVYEEEAPNTTDEQNCFLLLVNSLHPLPEKFSPKELVLLNELETGLFTVKEPNTYLCQAALSALIDMLTAAHQDGLTVWQISEGYRSQAAQQAIWDQTYNKYRTVNGLSEKKALLAVNRRVAKPGCSEHETGLALDITVPGTAFRATPQCVWIMDHCADYGFIVRYTDDKETITGISAEPWHLRFVGVQAAQEMRDKNLCLEEYVLRYGR